MARRKLIKESGAQRKTCSKCNSKLPLSKFYCHKKNTEYHFKDLWCRTCVQKYVVDLKALKEYCYFNNRGFNEELYFIAKNQIEADLITDAVYLIIDDMDKKNIYRFQKIASYYYQRMNMAQFYRYENHNNDINSTVKSVEQLIHDKQVAKHKEAVINEKEREYSAEWFGQYSKNELAFLDNYYAKMEQQFDISDIHLQITVREVAKAALEMHQAFNAMRAEEAGGANRYKNACDLFTKLSDSAKLSASKRTANDRVGFGDLGSLIKRVEYSGALFNKVKLPSDDIDAIRDDFRHILRSFSGEDLSGEDNGA